jgi:hypothetical protein
MQIPGSRFELGAFRQFAPSSTQIGVAVMLKSAHEAFRLLLIYLSQAVEQVVW